MNCEKCQALLSDFLDGHLKGEDQRLLNAHLEECLSCSDMREELKEILTFCHDHRGEYVSPPNEQALWVRIRNQIEIEQNTASRAAAESQRNARRPSWWSGLMGRSWELSLSQLTAAVAAIAIAVALATAFGVHSMQNGDNNRTARVEDESATNRSTRTGQTSGTFAVYNPDDLVRQQQATIEYWNQRVEQRKVRWNPQIREAFERNMSVIDQTVEDSRQVLRQNPHDEVYEEMLTTALNDKMELLKEFSDM